MPWRVWPALMLLVAIVVAVIGCSGGGEFCRVSGTVTYEDAPIQTGLITFEPSTGRSPPHEVAIRDGEFQATFAQRIKPGTYIVRVTAPDLSKSSSNANVGPNDPVPMTVPLLPASWNSESLITVDLVEGDNPIHLRGAGDGPPAASES